MTRPSQSGAARRTPRCSAQSPCSTAHSFGRTTDMRALSVLPLAVCLWLTGCATKSSPIVSPQTEEAAIRNLLAAQLEDWNKRNLQGFMAGYARSDTTHFASGGTLQLGWQAVFDRYRARYQDAAAMGKTTFSDLEVSILGADSAMAFGR